MAKTGKGEVVVIYLEPLPAQKRCVNIPFVNRKKPAEVTIDQTPVDVLPGQKLPTRAAPGNSYFTRISAGMVVAITRK